MIHSRWHTFWLTNLSVHIIYRTAIKRSNSKKRKCNDVLVDTLYWSRGEIRYTNLRTFHIYIASSCGKKRRNQVVSLIWKRIDIWNDLYNKSSLSPEGRANVESQGPYTHSTTSRTDEYWFGICLPIYTTIKSSSGNCPVCK